MGSRPIAAAVLAAALAAVLAACTGGGGGRAAEDVHAPAPALVEIPPTLSQADQAAARGIKIRKARLLWLDMWQRQHVDDRIPSYGSALHSAAVSGDLSAVKKLLADGANPNARAEVPLPEAAGLLPGTDSAPLQEVVRWGGRLDVVQALLAAGADPNARNEDGFALLHSAMFRNSDPGVIEALIAAGANPSARDEDNFARFRAAACRFFGSTVGPDLVIHQGGMVSLYSVRIKGKVALFGPVLLSPLFSTETGAIVLVGSDGRIVLRRGAAPFEGLTLIGPAFFDVRCSQPVTVRE